MAATNGFIGSVNWQVRNVSVAKVSQQKVRVEVLAVAAKAGGAKVRFTVSSDAYLEQCEAVAHRFDGAKWHELVRLATGEMQTKKGLVYGNVSEFDFRLDLVELAARAEKVLL